MPDKRVTVITLTYRRPDDLREALPVLVAAISGHPGADLVVVDNDVIPSAQPVVAEFGPSVRYVHEAHPGIASARNRGLDETAESEIIVFIDDDERPQPGWLASLLSLQVSTAAEAIAGPVVSVFEGELDPWIKAGRFFERRRHVSGTEVSVAATNNLLLDRAFVQRAGLRFDEAFGLSGGSDSVFTRQVRQAGGRILWCDEAVVIDVVPPDRATRRWVLRRAFRMGNTEARAQIHLARGMPRAIERAKAAVRGSVRVGGGLVQSCWGVATGSLARRARGRRKIMRGAGMVLAGFGYTYFEYGRNKKSQRAAAGESPR